MLLTVLAISDTMLLAWIGIALEDHIAVAPDPHSLGRILQGNADPGVLYGSKEGITEAVQEMVKGFWVGNKGWIANLGHGKFARAAAAVNGC